MKCNLTLTNCLRNCLTNYLQLFLYILLYYKILLSTQYSVYFSILINIYRICTNNQGHYYCSSKIPNIVILIDENDLGVLLRSIPRNRGLVQCANLCSINYNGLKVVYPYTLHHTIQLLILIRNTEYLVGYRSHPLQSHLTE